MINENFLTENQIRLVKILEMNKSVSIHQKHLQPLITDMYKLHAGLAIGIMVPFRLKQKVLKTFLLIVKGIVLLLLSLLA